jgi:hypothetical protein
MVFTLKLKNEKKNEEIYVLDPKQAKNQTDKKTYTKTRKKHPETLLNTDHFLLKVGKMQHYHINL